MCDKSIKHWIGKYIKANNITIEKQIISFSDNFSFKYLRMQDSSYRLIVMGKTGAGKSSVLNSLTAAEHFKVGDSIMSETKEVSTFCGKFKGRADSPDITFVDTPGFFDSSSRDNKIIAKIALTLHKINDGVNLVLFCFPAYEIRLDSSMQASWRFLKLIMGKAVYDHVVIVLTHGSRLETQELENAVARMTTEFIPYLQDKLKCKVRNEILIYKKGCEDDGLDDVLNYVMSNKKYKPEVMKDFDECWNPKNPLESIEYLLEHSETFGKIQELLSELHNKNKSIQGQMKKIKREMKSIILEKEKKTKKEIEKFACNLNDKLMIEKESVETLRDQITDKMQIMQQQMDEKNKQIGFLWKELHELKSMHDSLTIGPTEKTTPDSDRSCSSKRKLSLEKKNCPRYFKQFDQEHCLKNSYYASQTEVLPPEIKLQYRNTPKAVFCKKMLENSSTRITIYRANPYNGYKELKATRQDSHEKHYMSPFYNAKGVNTPYVYNGQLTTDSKKGRVITQDANASPKDNGKKVQLGNSLNRVKKKFAIESTKQMRKKHSKVTNKRPVVSSKEYNPRCEVVRNNYKFK